MGERERDSEKIKRLLKGKIEKRFPKRIILKAYCNLMSPLQLEAHHSKRKRKEIKTKKKIEQSSVNNILHSHSHSHSDSFSHSRSILIK